ncbi:CaiB/BaiF CoA transferase family protein [Wenxinia marina]|uniref:Putative acyl-CoA transferase/carnitine dehydratase n=1 Tax=Wenxinia marina DSM 24838 TaxID=1123501 RepID=A0A0D0NNJ3_9RHOB|nr:CoA transferase [Wenxinia marina]KIQ69820.1 putative acyl-CoA transferase/carnitine dehydratase [Wenxinia marina DSM 24838]GGL61508.1 CoA transferase [Wenxinia marina]
MGALDGLRVLDFSRLLPGPYCTWLLADQGAEVIRIETPRELAKQAKVFGWDRLDEEGRARQRAQDILARNKKSVLLDIGDEDARATIRALARDVDVVVEDFRPGVLAGLGLGHTDLSEGNPALVYASLTLCGQTGPYRDRPGHDPVALALSGVLSRTGEDPDAPGLPGVPNADVTTGAHAAFAILAARMEAQRTGQGRHVDVSMTDCSMSLIANVLSRYSDPADAPPRGQRRADLGLWRCADGRWLVTTDMEPRYWATFCEVMGRPDFVPHQIDPAKRDEIRATFAAAFAAKPRAEWLDILARAGTQFAPVNDVTEALADPHLIARGMVIEVAAPGGGTLTQIGAPVRLGPQPPPRAAVVPGADNDAVLGRLSET